MQSKHSLVIHHIFTMELNATPLSDEAPPLPRMRELRVEDALMYLDQVKMEFGDRPHIYDEFLDIMKTFKIQAIDAPGVMRNVASLFRGNERLLLGFETFLPVPEEYRIEWMELNATPSSDEAPLPDFDDATNYVMTIKRRFASNPETYRKFLETLQTYLKGQRGIKEVLDEVSILFADHADLLKEFTYFLPDAVQRQAKARLDDAAKNAEDMARTRETGPGRDADEFDEYFDGINECFDGIDEYFDGIDEVVVDGVIDN
jgi:histone deacetylase complex regulatory component SIN3